MTQIGNPKMSFLLLHELPTPPQGKCGWPWNVEPSALRPVKNDIYWPVISVITPSYNQGAFLEETIRSVLFQGYPNLEYIVIDGGSTDGTLDILKQYQKFFHYWVSEKDFGQSHAINKGFRQSSGEILCWLNSDDVMKPGTLHAVARQLRTNACPGWLIGASEMIGTQGQSFGIQRVEQIDHAFFFAWSDTVWIPQQSTFWNRAMWERVAPVREDLTYAMDVALWLKMIEYAIPLLTSRVLSCYRFHDDCKTVTHPLDSRRELIKLLRAYRRCHSELRNVGNLLEADQSEEILEWAYRSYYAHQYRQAKRCLTFALCLFPRLFFRKTWLFLAFQLTAGRLIGDKYGERLRDIVRKFNNAGINV